MDMNTYSANILLIDDEPLNIILLEKIFKRAGYQNIYASTDSREAVGLYVKHQIDVLLLDIRMPHLNGFEVLAELKNTVEEDYLPVLVLTAELTSETKIQSLAGGARDFITKPFDKLEVLQRTKNIIEVQLLHKKILQQNKNLELEVQKRTQELEDSRLEVIQRLGLAAEYKDNETGNHVLRMSKFAQLLASAAGFSDEDTETILCAAPMHDIGKIGIPDRVLLKPGKLDKAEWEIMQSHVEIGVQLLSGGHSPLLEMARIIALTHHEKWDGSGYPNGISGLDIPIEGRICAICDVFDALTSMRPYKQAWSVDKAMVLIKNERGKHFDPKLVDNFESILPEIISFRAEHQDL